MTAQEFVEKYFNFEALTPLERKDTHTAASILLRTYVQFYGRPPQEAKFLRELREAIEKKLPVQ